MDAYFHTDEFLASFIGKIPFGVLVLYEDGRVALANEVALRHLEIEQTPEALQGAYLQPYLDELPELRRTLNNGSEASAAAPFHFTLNVNHLYIFLQMRSVPHGYLLTTQDLTQQYRVERLRMSAMLEGQENERQRLAKELHDGLGPLLSTVRLHLDSVQGEIDPHLDKLHGQLDIMRKLIGEVADHLRTLSHDLVPGALMDFGLPTAISRLVDQTNAAGKVQLSFYTANIERRFDQALELHFFRVCQEAVNNAITHGRAEHISIQLIRHAESLLLMVEDDGDGFDARRTMQFPNMGIGLRSMWARARSLRGTLNIDSTPGRGTVVTLETPLG